MRMLTGMAIGGAAMALAACVSAGGATQTAAAPINPPVTCSISHAIAGTEFHVTRWEPDSNAMSMAYVQLQVRQDAPKPGSVYVSAWWRGRAGASALFELETKDMRTADASPLKVRLIGARAERGGTSSRESHWMMSFGWDDLAAAFAGDDELRFEVTRPDGTRVTAGTIELIGLREAMGVLPAIDDVLDGLMANPAGACRTDPYHSDYSYVCPAVAWTDAGGEFTVDRGSVAWRRYLGDHAEAQLSNYSGDPLPFAFTKQGFAALDGGVGFSVSFIQGFGERKLPNGHYAIEKQYWRYQRSLGDGELRVGDWSRRAALSSFRIDAYSDMFAQMQRGEGEIGVSAFNAQGAEIVRKTLPANTIPTVERALKQGYSRLIEMQRDPLHQCELSVVDHSEIMAN